ncbi:MAG: pyrimidine/purine nucleoside phosphorylase [Sedimentisphaerales bacterium]|nr:pyrimidine/purine nucleoside phosphorylase [Sedimentisphaerales bacterium]
MFKVNEYFDGKVKSLGFDSAEGPATIGVMAEGEYEFGTSTVEFMTITSGQLFVSLPGDNDWRVYGKGETFKVDANVKFKVKSLADVSYLCLYK